MSLDGRHLSHRVAAEYGTGGRFGWQSAGAPQEIAVDLTVLDDGKAPEDWTATELDAAARDAAFDAEVEEFCLALLTGTYPADFTPEDGAAESEASAE